LKCGIKFAIFVKKSNPAKLGKYMITGILAYTPNWLTINFMEELKMKKLFLFAVLPLFMAAGCTTQYQAKAPYDDVYYSSRDLPTTSSEKVVVAQSQVPVATDYTSSKNQVNNNDVSQSADNQVSGATEYTNYEDQPGGAVSESYTEPGGDTYINNNYYDNYYDYAYASRLRRFHSNYFMDSYYNDYYSNMYFYDYNPWSWGTSIYFNSGWYSPSFGMSFGWGWPSYSYGLGYPSYGSYWSGYYDGYYDGYWAGNSNQGWYSNDGGGHNNGYYYGHRGQSGFIGGSSNGRDNVGFRDQKPGRNGDPGDSEHNRGYGLGNTSIAGQRNITAAGGNAKRGEVTPSTGNESGVNGRAINSSNNRSQTGASVSSQVNERSRLNTQTGRTINPGYRGRYITPSRNIQRGTNTGNVKPGTRVLQHSRIANPQQPINTGANTSVIGQGNNTLRENPPSDRTQPARTYQQQGARIQSYSSPSYSKPRSSQEYTSPKYRNFRNTDNPNPSPQYSQPLQRSGSNGNNIERRSESPRQTITPSTQERQQSQPVYTAPSRSTENSYSAPSRSSGSSNSSSTPSRSSSGSSESGGRPRR
jgi:hypothetical protein